MPCFFGIMEKVLSFLKLYFEKTMKLEIELEVSHDFTKNY